MLFSNAMLFRDGRFAPGSFQVEEGRFAAFYQDKAAGEGVDLHGAKVIPGLIDVHSHGNSGADFSDGDYDGLRRMAAYYARNGITSFAPASMTLPYETLSDAFETAARLHRERPEGCARLLGIQMEGPFFSEKKKGAQNGDYLRVPDFEAFRALYEGCGGLLRIADVAPELPGAVDFIRRASALCTVSVAHTDASYEEARAAFEAGARHVTHLFNAMPPIHHRKPGVIGAAAEREDVVAELISDGQHLHPSIVRMAFRLFPGRVCLISDSLRCCGMPDGEYELGGQQVFLRDGIARLADGTIAGSATNLFQCMLRAISFGVPAAEAITAATLTPAREIGADGLVGSLEVGKLADFVVCDENLNALSVWLGGKQQEEHA